MQFTHAIHVFDMNARIVTFGISHDGNVWIATDTGNPRTPTEYFEFTPEAFSEVADGIARIYVIARHNLAGKLANGTESPTPNP